MLKEDLDIVTSCDENYNIFLKNFVINVHKIFSRKPYVYDLGLKKETRSNNNANFVNINLNEDYKKINEENCIRAIHKPLCIIDHMQKTDRPFIFIDTDCLFIEDTYSFKEDISFTYRLYSEQTQRDFKKNGYINSGVLLFKNEKNKKEENISFLNKWLHRCTETEEITDQKALSDILLEINGSLVPGDKIYHNGLTFKILPAEKYNDIKCQTGKIWHFKGAGRRPDKMTKYLRACTILHNARGIVLVFTFLQRIAFAIKCLFRPSRYKYRYLEAQTK
ncbi:MAG: putative nucleotide-diphospho-sugar transferase [Desulfonatronovibrionaceae bacterium]